MDVCLVGIAGYGDLYLGSLLNEAAAHGVRLVAGVDPRPEASKRYAQVIDRGISLFPSMQAMYASGMTPDLVILATPLHLHADQAELAMERGSHVLCEKPMAATPEDALRMIDARNRTKRTLAIGFQWPFAEGVRRLKADIIDGRFGRPMMFKAKVYWPRAKAYYGRNGWAGRVTTADGRPVFDSPVNNACAHFIHNMLDLLGAAPDQADWPATVTAELYRANDIENYDTAVLRCRTMGGVDVFAAVSHATERALEPALEYEFEHGRLISDESTGWRMIASDRDGEAVDYGPQPTGADIEKLWATIESIRTGSSPACSPESAAAHTALTAAVQHSGNITEFGTAYVTELNERDALCVPGLDAVLDRCFADGCLPSELGVPWARAGEQVRVDRKGRVYPVPMASVHLKKGAVAVAAKMR